MHRLPIGRILLLLIAAGLGWWWWQGRPLRHAPGVLVAKAPVQADVAPQDLGAFEGFKLTAVARYTIRGRVLGKKRYYSGLQAELVPMDVALGWGRMSDQAVLDRLGISMSNRFFFYEWRGAPPMPPTEIVRSASNHHIIAKDGTVAATVSGLRIGSIAEMEGWLVDAEGPGGFRWKTSRRRDDTGNGACELFLVEKARAWAEAPASTPEPPAAPLISPVPS